MISVLAESNGKVMIAFIWSSNGKKIINRESEPQAEVFFARLHPLPALWPAAWLSAQV